MIARPSLLLAAVLFALPAAGAVGAPGDAARGETLYRRCAGCHSPDRDRTGPRHCELFGRRAGAVDGFAYSKAMRESGITWDQESLDRFLSAPLRMLPGTRMGYAGMRDPGERRDLIAYLATLTADSPACR